MNCTNPIYKILGIKGKNWGTLQDYQNNRAIKLPCNKCKQCKIAKMYKWVNRLTLEIRNQKRNNGNMYFITLTYNNENLEKSKNHIQELSKWIKRIRGHNKNLKIKYFAVSEIGKEHGRYHHHIILFSNIDILPKQSGGKKLGNHYYYQNKKIKWNYGMHSIQKINIQLDNGKPEQVLKYVLKYIVKNPLSYQFSRKLGYEEMEKTRQEDGTFIYNGYKKKIPGAKAEYLTNKQLITKLKQNETTTTPAKDFNYLPNEPKEVKEWTQNNNKN